MIFMNLQKGYEDLERSRYLEILEGYGVGPRACRLLWIYWGRLRMVAKAGGYYGSSFQGSRGMMQGRDVGGPAISHHLQCGDGCGGAKLGRSDGEERRRAEQAQKIGQTLKSPLLHG